MKRLQLALICVSVTACAESGGADQAADPATAGPPVMVFESNTPLSASVLSGASCDGNQRLDAAFEVYDNEGTFSAAFKALRPDLPVPSVDFERYVVAGAFLGQVRGCGSRVTISSATSRDDRIDVEVTAQHPGASCAADQSRASPYVFAQLDRTDLPYVRVDRVEEIACP